MVRFSSLGDIVLSSVVTQQLSRHFPQADITFLTKSKYVSLAAMLSGVTQVRGYDYKVSFLSLISDLRKENYDFLVDLHTNWRSFWIRNLSGPAQKTHYRSSRLRRMAIVALPSLPLQAVSTTSAYLETLSEFGIPLQNLKPSLQLGSQELEQAQQFLRERKIDLQIPLIAVAPGARWESKRWPAERFSEVARQLKQQTNSQIIFFGSRPESDLLHFLSQQIKESILAIDLPYNLVAGLIQKCRLMISNDSGLMHIASALNIPTVAIFGPTHPRLGFAPNGNRSVVLTSNQPCSPCSLHGKNKCFQPARYCLENISVEMVLNACHSLLNVGKVELASPEK